MRRRNAAAPEKVAQSRRLAWERRGMTEAEYFRAWRKANPEKARENGQRAFMIRRQRKCGAVGHATPGQIASRVAYYGGRCWMCGAPYEHIDHVIPLSRGGSNWPANLRPACKSCNSRKGARRIHQMPWLKERGITLEAS